MISIDHWTFKCARCNWKVMDEFTVNSQQAVAEALVRRHIYSHEARETVTAHVGAHVAKDSASRSSGSQPVGGGVENKEREDHLP